MKEYFFFQNCPSTQVFVKDLNSIEPIVKTSALTKNQPNGLGTHGRTWTSAEGNFFCSFKFEVKNHQNLSLIPLQIATFLKRNLHHEIKIRWPNDLIIDKPKSNLKLGGILAELRQSTLIVGIGINLATHPNLESTSILESFNIQIRPFEFFKKIQNIDSEIFKIQIEEKDFWIQKNEKISFKIHEVEKTGTFLRLNQNGTVDVESENSIFTLTSGPLRKLT